MDRELNDFTDKDPINIGPELKQAYKHFIAVKTNAYLPWITTICVVVQVIFMFTDYYVRKTPSRIYARIPPVVMGTVVFFLWLYKTPPQKLYSIRRLWDISCFLAGYWLCIISYGTSSFVATLGSIPFLAFCITFLSFYDTKYLFFLFSSSFLLFVTILILFNGVRKDLFDLNASVLMMIFCLILNHWRHKLYFSEFSLKNRLETTLKQLLEAQNRLVYTEKMAALGELTAGIAHEIQNPLNFVINFTELSEKVMAELYQHPDNSKLRHLLYSDLESNFNKIIFHGNRISNIVTGMLNHSRHNSFERIPKLTDLTHLINEYLHIAYDNARIKHKNFQADFITNYDKRAIIVKVIPEEISRVLLNIFDNAFYAVREKQKKQSAGYAPTIIVTDSINNGLVEIRISDNGTGVPKEIRSKIFQPFVTNKSAEEGTGLGLSISFDIITKGHGGTLDIVTEEGLGTEFIIRLPQHSFVSSDGID